MSPTSSHHSFLPIFAVAATATTLLTVLYLKKLQEDAEAKAAIDQDKDTKKNNKNEGEAAAYMTNDRGLLLSPVDDGEKPKEEEETNPLAKMWKNLNNNNNNNNKPKNESKEVFRETKDGAGKEGGEPVNPKDSFEQVDKPSDDEAEEEKKPFWGLFMPKKEPPKVEIPEEPKPKEEEHLSLWDSISSGFGSKHGETPDKEDEKRKVAAEEKPPSKKGFFGFGKEDKESNPPPAEEKKPEERKSFFGFGSPKKEQDATTESKKDADKGQPSPKDGDIAKQHSMRNFFGFGEKPVDDASKEKSKNEETAASPKSPARRKIFGFDINKKDEDKKKEDDSIATVEKKDDPNAKKGFWGNFSNHSPKESQPEKQQTAKDESKKTALGESDHKPKRQSFMDAFLHPDANKKGASVDVTDSPEESSDSKTDK